MRPFPQANELDPKDWEQKKNNSSETEKPLSIDTREQQMKKDLDQFRTIPFLP